MNQQERKERQSRFIDTLHSLERGDVAILKRNAGKSLGESRKGMPVFFRILPAPFFNSYVEELCYLICTLYGHNAYHAKGSLGKSMRRARHIKGSASLDQRMTALLDSRFDLIDGFKPGGGEMAYRLRQTVKLLASEEVGIDWLELLNDLSNWNHENRFVQKKWARDYFMQEQEEREYDKEDQ